MSRVYRMMLRCPVTKLGIDTGIRTSGREALNSSIYQEGRIHCPHCGQFHRMEGNAFLLVDTNTPEDALWRPNP